MSKHPLSGHEPDPLPNDDLEFNPGIGQSRGLASQGGVPDELAGENTTEGDIENDVGPDGRVDPGISGRSHP
jgi:hypothetical protein